MDTVPRILYDDADEFVDGTRYEVIVYEVEASNAYPEGERYSFQYMDADDSTLLRGE